MLRASFLYLAADLATSQIGFPPRPNPSRVRRRPIQRSDWPIATPHKVSPVYFAPSSRSSSAQFAPREPPRWVLVLSWPIQFATSQPPESSALALVNHLLRPPDSRTLSTGRLDGSTGRQATRAAIVQRRAGAFGRLLIIHILTLNGTPLIESRLPDRPDRSDRPHDPRLRFGPGGLTCARRLHFTQRRPGVTSISPAHFRVPTLAGSIRLAPERRRTPIRGPKMPHLNWLPVVITKDYCPNGPSNYSARH